MIPATQNSVRMLRLTEVIDKTGLSRSTIYAKMQASSPHYDPHFPKKIRLSSRAIAFIEEEVDHWLWLKYEESNPDLPYGNGGACE